MFIWENKIATRVMHVPGPTARVSPHPQLRNEGPRRAGPHQEDTMGVKAHFNLNAVNMLRVTWDKWDT